MRNEHRSDAHGEIPSQGEPASYGNHNNGSNDRGQPSRASDPFDGDAETKRNVADAKANEPGGANWNADNIDLLGNARHIDREGGTASPMSTTEVIEAGVAVYLQNHQEIVDRIRLEVEEETKGAREEAARIIAKAEEKANALVEAAESRAVAKALKHSNITAILDGIHAPAQQAAKGPKRRDKKIPYAAPADHPELFPEFITSAAGKEEKLV